MSRQKRMQIVMAMAWQFVRETGMSLGAAMHTAYLNLKLRARLAVEKAHFVYRKANGEIREAWGISAKAGEDTVKGTGKGQPARNLLYWDLEANNFRAFTKANLLDVL